VAPQTSDVRELGMKKIFAILVAAALSGVAGV